MNIELRDVISGLPVATSTDVASLTTTAAEPLSYIAVIRAVVLTRAFHRDLTVELDRLLAVDEHRRVERPRVPDARCR